MKPEDFGALGGNLTKEQQIDDRMKIALGEEFGGQLPNTIAPRVLSVMLEKLPKLEGTPITAEELTASLLRLGYRLIEEDAEEPFYQRD